MRRTETVCLKIDTGSEAPKHSDESHPLGGRSYQMEIGTLVEDGILKPFSTWSSYMVTIRKTEGSVRVCLNFKKLNGITMLDPCHLAR